jgi:hypothetical protein
MGRQVVHKRTMRIFGGMAHLRESLCARGRSYLADAWIWRKVTCKRCLWMRRR